MDLETGIFYFVTITLRKSFRRRPFYLDRVPWGPTLAPCMAQNDDSLSSRHILRQRFGRISAVQRFFATIRYHFGFILPKSVLTCRFSDRFESNTRCPARSRTKTTQCQHGLPFSRCHLIASKARSGRLLHERKGLSTDAGRSRYSFKRRRTWPVSDHNRRSPAKMPRPFAVR